MPYCPPDPRLTPGAENLVHCRSIGRATTLDGSSDGSSRGKSANKILLGAVRGKAEVEALSGTCKNYSVARRSPTGGGAAMTPRSPCSPCRRPWYLPTHTWRPVARGGAEGSSHRSVLEGDVQELLSAGPALGWAEFMPLGERLPFLCLGELPGTEPTTNIAYTFRRSAEHRVGGLSPSRGGASRGWMLGGRSDRSGGEGIRTPLPH